MDAIFLFAVMDREKSAKALWAKSETMVGEWF
jgi:hypothetical protein